MNSYLVSFKYDYYCQGTESTYISVFVRNAETFEDACEQIIDNHGWDNPREFENLTV